MPMVWVLCFKVAYIAQHALFDQLPALRKATLIDVMHITHGTTRTTWFLFKSRPSCIVHPHHPHPAYHQVHAWSHVTDTYHICLHIYKCMALCYSYPPNIDVYICSWSHVTDAPSACEESIHPQHANPFSGACVRVCLGNFQDFRTPPLCNLGPKVHWTPCVNGSLGTSLLLPSILYDQPPLSCMSPPCPSNASKSRTTTTDIMCSPKWHVHHPSCT